MAKKRTVSLSVLLPPDVAKDLKAWRFRNEIPSVSRAASLLLRWAMDNAEVVSPVVRYEQTNANSSEPPRPLAEAPVPTDLVSVREAAATLEVNIYTVYHWISAGRIVRYGGPSSARVSLRECAQRMRYPPAQHVGKLQNLLRTRMNKQTTQMNK